MLPSAPCPGVTILNTDVARYRPRYQLPSAELLPIGQPGAAPDFGVSGARLEQVDIAVLDLAIEDGNTFPVAKILHERGVPFIFVTGLDKSS
jgi:hypothetical protein